MQKDKIGSDSLIYVCCLLSLSCFVKCLLGLFASQSPLCVGLALLFNIKPMHVWWNMLRNSLKMLV